MKPTYCSIGDMLEMIDEPWRSAVTALYVNNHLIIRSAPGSAHNHQAWGGGFLDHVRDGMNLILVMYQTLGSLRSLPFSISDALLVFFLHDIEKPWKYIGDTGVSLGTKAERKTFRLKKMQEYGVVLTSEQTNALEYIEGEGDKYEGGKRVMNELAGFCHVIDVLSARVWHDYPKSLGEDPWTGASRING